MNIPVRHATAATKLAIVDCDIHPAFRKPSDLYPFLPAQWREHMITFGEHLRQGLSGQLAWPRMSASGLRVDAFPEDGPPGSDLELMRSAYWPDATDDHGDLAWRLRHVRRGILKDVTVPDVLLAGASDAPAGTNLFEPPGGSSSRFATNLFAGVPFSEPCIRHRL